VAMQSEILLFGLFLSVRLDYVLVEVLLSAILLRWELGARVIVRLRVVWDVRTSRVGVGKFQKKPRYSGGRLTFERRIAALPIKRRLGAWQS
jgi:hypothetical protein